MEAAPYYDGAIAIALEAPSWAPYFRNSYRSMCRAPAADWTLASTGTTKPEDCLGSASQQRLRPVDVASLLLPKSGVQVFADLCVASWWQKERDCVPWPAIVRGHAGSSIVHGLLKGQPYASSGAIQQDAAPFPGMPSS